MRFSQGALQLIKKVINYFFDYFLVPVIVLVINFYNTTSNYASY